MGLIYAIHHISGSCWLTSANLSKLPVLQILSGVKEAVIYGYNKVITGVGCILLQTPFHTSHPPLEIRATSCVVGGRLRLSCLWKTRYEATSCPT